ncbi:hypothetical protein ANANG_G00047140 [Anguilla anguilla]|uniref:Uncharacterized protein n=1 Tax=Anguilla anguilla TaxID=7936 RepID=A0A9D3S597_ANGAN|nr:hypothetical protein ANANG_G00047140 [Anguilla anguilla]
MTKAPLDLLQSLQQSQWRSQRGTLCPLRGALPKLKQRTCLGMKLSLPQTKRRKRTPLNLKEVTQLSQRTQSPARNQGVTLLLQT